MVVVLSSSFSSFLKQCTTSILKKAGLFSYGARDHTVSKCNNSNASVSVTPHCNDDLSNINEHHELMINSSKRLHWLCKIIVFKMISPAIFEIEASMHNQSAQIWRNFWPVLYRPSKTAGDIILKIGILHSQSIHLLEFIIGSSCSFILLRSSLQ